MSDGYARYYKKPLYIRPNNKHISYQLSRGGSKRNGCSYGLWYQFIHLSGWIKRFLKQVCSNTIQTTIWWVVLVLKGTSDTSRRFDWYVLIVFIIVIFYKLRQQVFVLSTWIIHEGLPVNRYQQVQLSIGIQIYQLYWRRNSLFAATNLKFRNMLFTLSLFFKWKLLQKYLDKNN